ncbi:MAG TPA: pirin family protein [Methylomirabilota bacterium]|nr:pirin family protein [Methylomirabilota bacterium]
MIEIVKAKERYHFENEWLSTYWHFSFDHYYDPKNVSFGHLRVFNHDFIKPGTGFPPHSHRDMEIITYVLRGELEHEDNQENRGLIRAGEVQIMSAGTGITHAERNPSATELLELLQIWILPNARGLPPRWEQRQFSPVARQDVLLPVVSRKPVGDELAIDQNATIYVSGLTQGRTIRHHLIGERAHLFVIDGKVALNQTRFDRWDSGRITGDPDLSLTALETTELILLDLD